jgi:phosphate transport system ATP-binding protein
MAAQTPSVTLRDRSSDSSPAAVTPKIDVQSLSFYYGAKRALEGITLQIQPNLVTAFIGPSGCGKSTFLRTLNRMNDIIPGTRVEGKVLIDEIDIYGPGVDVVGLRRRVGMVFQKSNPFPKSIFDNVAYGLRINGMAGSRADLIARVEESLRQAALWDEVKDRLEASALALSGALRARSPSDRTSC